MGAKIRLFRAGKIESRLILSTLKQIKSGNEVRIEACESKIYH